jgi:MFS family permease
MWSRWLPDELRGRATSLIYGCFSAGTVLGLAATPFIAEAAGWPVALQAFGGVGLTAAVGRTEGRKRTQPGRQTGVQMEVGSAQRACGHECDVHVSNARHRASSMGQALHWGGSFRAWALTSD